MLACRGCTLKMRRCQSLHVEPEANKGLPVSHAYGSCNAAASHRGADQKTRKIRQHKFDSNFEGEIPKPKKRGEICLFMLPDLGSNE